MYLIYSSLFSSVTWMFPPSGFSSCVVTSPRISLSTEKNISSPHSSILLSLQATGTYSYHQYESNPAEDHKLGKKTPNILNNLDNKINKSALNRMHFNFFLMSMNNLLDPDERVIKLWIYGLQVFESQRFVQNTLVERQ